MKILAVSNQKGGVGKTTLSVHLAYAAYERGLRVLLIDMDTQENASMMFEPADTSQEFIHTSQLFNEQPSQLPIEFVKPSLGLIRADKVELTAIADLKDADGLENRAIATVAQYKKQFDICILDTPPARNILLFTSLVMADKVLTPIKFGKWEMSGFADLLDDIAAIQSSGLNPNLKHIGSICSKINTRSQKQMEYLEAFKLKYKSAVLNTYLSEREAVQVAINEGRPVWDKVKGVSHKKTAQEWRDACETILNLVVKG